MKFLYITHLSGKRVNRLWLSALNAANELGYEVHLACNMSEIDKDGWTKDCEYYKLITHQIDFNRNPLSPQNIRAKKQLCNLMQKEHFDIVHCNTPIGGVVGRLCAEKAEIPYIIYQAHGFHFWKGAPLINWLIYYNVEKMLARKTDVLITINDEDYNAAKKFKLRKNGQLKLVHGVGINTDIKCNNSTLRAQLNIPEDSYVYISVGEINKNKNQKTLIDAFVKANINNSYLLICGQGNKELELKKYAEKYLNIKFLGFRSDIFELLNISDCFVFPSYREGLPTALMEAMACGINCIASNIRGNVDLLGKDYEFMFFPDDTETLAKLMVEIRSIKKKINYKNLPKYKYQNVKQELMDIYNR